MRIRYSLSLMLVVAFITGCQIDKVVDSDGFQSVYSLTHKSHGEVFLRQPQIRVANSALIMVSHLDSETVCRFYSIDNQVEEIGSFGKIGNGPDEFLQPVLTYADGDEFGINDINLSTLSVLKIKEERNAVSAEILKKMKAPYKRIKGEFTPKDVRFIKIGNQNYVSSLCASNGQFFTLFDSELQPIARFGDSPIKEDVSTITMRSRMGGKTAVNNYSFYYAATDLPYLASYTLQNGKMKKDWELFYREPFYGVSNGDIKYSKENSTGPVIDMEVDDKYIYVLYLDQLLSEYDYTQTEKSLSNTIFIFNHQGEKVARLNLDCRLSEMAIDAKRMKVFGIAEIPDVTLVEFKLPENLFSKSE